MTMNCQKKLSTIIWLNTRKNYYRLFFFCLFFLCILADAFIQSDLVQSGYTFFVSMCSLGIEHNLCAANAMR